MNHKTDAEEISTFLTDLAVNGKVSAATQNQAFFALLFLYRDVLRITLPHIEGVIRAKRPEHLPIVFTSDEAKAILERLDGVPFPVASFLYGSGCVSPKHEGCASKSLLAHICKCAE